MKIVLSGYYGFHNVGDEAILLAIITAIKKVAANAEITVLSNDPDYTRKTYQVQAVNRWKIAEVIKAIKASDGLISGGGSLLQDKTGNRSISYYCAVMLIAKMVGKPFIVYAQGIGPIEKSFNKQITKFTLTKAALITVRDKASQQFLLEIGVKKPIEEVPDPVLGIDICKDRELPWLAPEKPFISVSIRDWPSEVNYLEELAKALDKLINLGYELVFVPMHGEHDERTSVQMVKLMKEKAYVAPWKLTIEDKVALIGKSQQLIGMRLHALIFAAVMDVPFTAISYDPKIDAFAKQCQQPVACHVESSNWTAADVYAISQQQLANLVAYRNKLKAYTDKAKTVAMETAASSIAKFN